MLLLLIRYTPYTRAHIQNIRHEDEPKTQNYCKISAIDIKNVRNNWKLLVVLLPAGFYSPPVWLLFLILCCFFSSPACTGFFLVLNEPNEVLGITYGPKVLVLFLL